MKFDKLFFTITAILAINLVSGCSTEVMKASPFYSGKVIAGVNKDGQFVRYNDPLAVKVKEAPLSLDPERVQVWPLFYKNYMIYSILWPFIEINDVGWQVRPLVSVDNYHESYRTLLTGWNSKKKSNYIFPLYY